MKKAKKNDVMEKYRKLSIFNYVIKNHDKKTH